MKTLSTTQPYLDEASIAIQQHSLVAVPTETVYGLAGRADSENAIQLIYKTKGRPSFNPLIVHASNIQHAQEFGEFSDLALQYAEMFWPGPLTLIVPLKPNANIAPSVTAGLQTIALRCPNSDVMCKLIQHSGHALAAPSANPSTRISPTTAQHVQDAFKGQSQPCIIIDGGPCQIGLESTVLDVTGSTPILLRAGGIQAKDLNKVSIVQTAHQIKDFRSPGMLEKHYAPSKPVILNCVNPAPEDAIIAFGPVASQHKHTFQLSISEDLTEAAHNLFSCLHAADDTDCKRIVIMPIPTTDIGIAIHDRLTRAAQKQ